MEISRLLKLLNEHKVRYIVIGAAAFPVHGYVRATLDLDIFIEASPENVSRVKRALTAFGYDLGEVTDQEMLTSKILIRQYELETDIHPFVSGVAFAEVWKNRVEYTIDGITAPFANLEDLIRMKKAAGRPKDMEDIKALIRIQERKKAGDL